MEDFRAHEGSIQQSIVQSPAISNDMSFARHGGMRLMDLFFVILILGVGLNMISLSVSETPIISPSPERIAHTGGDTSMVNS